MARDSRRRGLRGFVPRFVGAGFVEFGFKTQNPKPETLLQVLFAGTPRG